MDFKEESMNKNIKSTRRWFLLITDWVTKTYKIYGPFSQSNYLMEDKLIDKCLNRNKLEPFRFQHQNLQPEQLENDLISFVRENGLINEKFNYSLDSM